MVKGKIAPGKAKRRGSASVGSLERKECASCHKPINPEYAVKTDVGLKHQSCFRKCV